MSVTAKTKELVNSMNGLMKDYMDLIGGMDIMSMDTSEFKAVKSSIELVKLSSEVMMEQAKTIDEINRKLDMLLLMRGEVYDDQMEENEMD